MLDKVTGGPLKIIMIITITIKIIKIKIKIMKMIIKRFYQVLLFTLHYLFKLLLSHKE